MLANVAVDLFLKGGPVMWPILFCLIAALVVAIPSVFGYNLLLGQTKEMITEIENFASSLADRIELET